MTHKKNMYLQTQGCQIKTERSRTYTEQVGFIYD